jgi:translocation and assembly module TamA
MADRRDRPRSGPARFALWALCLVGAAAARAEIDVEIRGVDAELETNVRALLSIERFKKREKLREETIERLHERVEREVKAALRPFGFYEPVIRSAVEARNGGKDHRVTIEIDTGPPVVVRSVDVSITGPRAGDAAFQEIVAQLPMQQGDRLRHADYDRTKGALLRAAATYGYLDARLLANELRVDPAARTADIVLALETGERYRFGPTTIEQGVIREDLMRKFLRYREGQPYDATELLRTQFALDDSQYFSTVEVLPQPRDRDNLIVPIRIAAIANRRDRWSFGFGYGTDTEFRGTITWDNRLVNDRGHRFRVEMKAASTQQSLSARYIWPIGDPALEKFELDGTYRRQEIGDLDTQNTEGTASVTHILGQWQRVLFGRASYAITEVATSRRETLLFIPGISYASVPTGYLGEALFGRQLYAELRGSHRSLGADADFLQLVVQLERVIDLGTAWHLLLRGQVGATATENFVGVPGSERFFAGGDRTVRGFDFNELSPVRTVVDPATGETVELRVGGRHMVAATTEVIRDLPKNFGVAAFVDVGNAFDRFGDPLEYSVGLGVRLRLPVATVGIDVAQPLSESDRSPRLHINFSPKL